MVKRLGHIIRFIFARFKWYRKSCGGRWAKVTGYLWARGGLRLTWIGHLIAVDIEKLMKETGDEWLLCPVHSSLDQRGALKPFDNCIACIRNQRDELLEKLKNYEQVDAALGITFGGTGGNRMANFNDCPIVGCQRAGNHIHEIQGPASNKVTP